MVSDSFLNTTQLIVTRPGNDCYIAIEHGHLQGGCPFKMVIVHTYVSLPEGSSQSFHVFAFFEELSNLSDSNIYLHRLFGRITTTTYQCISVWKKKLRNHPPWAKTIADHSNPLVNVYITMERSTMLAIL